MNTYWIPTHDIIENLELMNAYNGSHVDAHEQFKIFNKLFLNSSPEGVNTYQDWLELTRQQGGLEELKKIFNDLTTKNNEAKSEISSRWVKTKTQEEKYHMVRGITGYGSQAS